MLSETTTLPFTIPDIFGGLAEAKGLLRVNDETLALEFAVKESFFGLLTLNAHELDLPLRQLDSVDLRQGWFSHRLNLQFKSLRGLEHLPRSEGGRCQMAIARRDQATAQKTVALLQLKIAELQV